MHTLPMRYGVSPNSGDGDDGRRQPCCHARSLAGCRAATLAGCLCSVTGHPIRVRPPLLSNEAVAVPPTPRAPRSTRLDAPSPALPHVPFSDPPSPAPLASTAFQPQPATHGSYDKASEASACKTGAITSPQNVGDPLPRTPLRLGARWVGPGSKSM